MRTFSSIPCLVGSREELEIEFNHQPLMTSSIVTRQWSLDKYSSTMRFGEHNAWGRQHTLLWRDGGPRTQHPRALIPCLSLSACLFISFTINCKPKYSTLLSSMNRSSELWSLEWVGEPQIHSGVGGWLDSLGLSQLWLVTGVGGRDVEGHRMGQSP